MKRTFLFCTKPLFYLTELPPVAILIFAISQNSNAEGALKLYPLIAFLCLCIIMIFLYFFRLIIISTEEIRTVGLFSSRDHAVIDKGKTLSAIIRRDGYVKIELSEKTASSSFSWNKDKNTTLTDMNLYRERAVGGRVAVSKILNYFSVPKQDQKGLFGDDNFNKEYENFILSSSVNDTERRIDIEFTQTI